MGVFCGACIKIHRFQFDQGYGQMYKRVSDTDGKFLMVAVGSPTWDGSD